MNNIAIIPARSGSKGLINKNIKELAGKPLLYYSIKAALSSAQFSKVIVSTDSEEYADIARTYGAEVPFLRSRKTSTDEASSWDVVLEILEKYEKMGQRFDTVCLLQPTSPLRSETDINAAYKLFVDNKAFSVVSMTELEHPMAWCGVLGDNNSIDGFIARDNVQQRQLQKNYYRPNGAIYIVAVPELISDQFLYRQGSYAYIMPKERSVDIDTEFDFKFAEFLMQYRNRL